MQECSFICQSDVSKTCNYWLWLLIKYFSICNKRKQCPKKYKITISRTPTQNKRNWGIVPDEPFVKSHVKVSEKQKDSNEW